MVNQKFSPSARNVSTKELFVLTEHQVYTEQLIGLKRTGFNAFPLLCVAKTRLTSGNHRYSFECQLMTVIPVTVVESGGLVRYRASIRFDELWDSPPIHEEEFTVAKPLDLNLFPRLKVAHFKAVMSYV